MAISIESMSERDKKLKLAGDVIAKELEELLKTQQALPVSLTTALDSLCDYFESKYEEFQR